MQRLFRKEFPENSQTIHNFFEGVGLIFLKNAQNSL